MLKRLIILLVVMSGIIGTSTAQDKAKSNYDKKIRVIRTRTGVDSLTALRILSIEKVYKSGVALLSLRSDVPDAEMRKQTQLLIDKKNMELAKFLPKATLLVYLPVSEGMRLDPSFTPNLLSRGGVAAERKGAGDASKDDVKSARRNAVNEIAATYAKKMDNIKKTLPDGKSKDAELERLLLERNQTMAKFLTGKGGIQNVKAANQSLKQNP